jgi:hypothetical protein
LWVGVWLVLGGVFVCVVVCVCVCVCVCVWVRVCVCVWVGGCGWVGGWVGGWVLGRLGGGLFCCCRWSHWMWMQIKYTLDGDGTPVSGLAQDHSARPLATVPMGPS